MFSLVTCILAHTNSLMCTQHNTRKLIIKTSCCYNMFDCWNFLLENSPKSNHYLTCLVDVSYLRAGSLRIYNVLKCKVLYQFVFLLPFPKIMMLEFVFILFGIWVASNDPLIILWRVRFLIISFW